jgi:hypothetical protein
VRADVLIETSSLSRHQISIELEGTELGKFCVDARGPPLIVSSTGMGSDLAGQGCGHRRPQALIATLDKRPQEALRSRLFSVAAYQASMNARARELTSSTCIPGL